MIYKDLKKGTKKDTYKTILTIRFNPAHSRETRKQG